MKPLILFLVVVAGLPGQSAPRSIPPNTPQRANMPLIPPPAPLPAQSFTIMFSSEEVTAMEWARLEERGPILVDSKGTMVQTPVHASLQDFIEWMTRGYCTSATCDAAKVNKTSWMQFTLNQFGAQAVAEYKAAHPAVAPVAPATAPATPAK